jgi:hypothetical protein
MTQLAYAATVVVQPLALKSPLAVILVKVKDADWLLVTVIVLELLVVPTVWLANMTVPLGKSVTGCTPEPVRLVLWGLLLASSVTVSVPLLEPRLVGVKVMLITQVL